MSKSLSVEAPYVNVLCQPTGCPQRAESNQTAKEQHLQVFSSTPSFKHTRKYNQLGHRAVICAAWQNMTLERACHCSCSSAEHRLSFQRHPVLTIKVISLIFPTIPRAELCCAALISVVGWTADISPCFSSAQVSLMLSTRLAHHWQRACLTPGTPGGPWKDTTALQHTQIPGSCPSFAGRTAAWLKMARWYICSPRWNYTQAIGAAGSFYFYLWM